MAEKLGARRAQPGTRFAEQRLVNIVGEICIAAHMPAPAVMVLPRHEGINAFATGTTPLDWAVNDVVNVVDTLHLSCIQRV